jgi:hypothetical protein
MTILEQLNYLRKSLAIMADYHGHTPDPDYSAPEILDEFKFITPVSKYCYDVLEALDKEVSK